LLLVPELELVPPPLPLSGVRTFATLVVVLLPAQPPPPPPPLLALPR
jgi:hypothetical protein